MILWASAWPSKPDLMASLMNSARPPETVIHRPWNGFVLACSQAQGSQEATAGAARQLEGLVVIVKAFAFRNLLSGQLRAWAMDVIIAEGAIVISLFHNFSTNAWTLAP